MPQGSMYEDGTYARLHPTWDSEDSPWKAAQILKILERNRIRPATVCEIGCGAGGILKELRDAMDGETRFAGYEISPQAIELCRKQPGERLEFFQGDFLDGKEAPYDLLLAIDLIEHLEDPARFLREIRSRGTFKVFYIPLELFALAALSRTFLPGQREKSGHLHFFTKEIALRLLRDAGYEVVDSFYTPGYRLSTWKTLTDLALSVPRRALFPLFPDATVRCFGGYSLLVLAR